MFIDSVSMLGFIRYIWELSLNEMAAAEQKLESKKVSTRRLHACRIFIWQLSYVGVSEIDMHNKYEQMQYSQVI